jgi:hypothetical protein
MLAAYIDVDISVFANVDGLPIGFVRTARGFLAK